MDKQLPVLKASDFDSFRPVKWCPGCGLYSVRAQLLKAMAQLGVPPENVSVMTGFDCNLQFAYIVNGFNMQGVAGRQICAATGLKIASPKQSVWVTIGDEEAAGKGLTHLLHAVNNNVDINIIILNDRIHGLTKGQASPTSPMGKIAKSTPLGKVERQMNLAELVLGANPYILRAGSRCRHQESYFHSAACRRTQRNFRGRSLPKLQCL